MPHRNPVTITTEEATSSTVTNILYWTRMLHQEPRSPTLHGVALESLQEP